MPPNTTLAIKSISSGHYFIIVKHSPISRLTAFVALSLQFCIQSGRNEVVDSSQLMEKSRTGQRY